MTTRVASMLLLSVVFAACTYVMPTPAPPTCGDGVADENETCDDGNDVDGDDCDTNCTPTGCGNGITTGAEECDDGNSVNDDACNKDCKRALCQDGVVNVSNDIQEECDDGNSTDNDACRNDCTKARCGDNVVNLSDNVQEECDDGNLDPDDSCDPNCKVPGCGNGYRAANEACDDGNLDNGDGCDPTCTLTNTTSIFLGQQGVSGNDDGKAESALLSGRPVMTIHERTLYFTSAATVRMVNLDAPIVTTIAGAGGLYAYADSTDGPAARFDWIEGIATDGQTLWIADNGNHLLRSVSLKAPYAVATEAGHTTSVGMNFQSIPGIGTQAEFDNLRGLAYYNGLVYLLDSNADVLQSFDPITKEVKTIAGAAYQSDVRDGAAADARFRGPRLMRSDGAGKLYIGDAFGGAIRVYDITQQTVSTIAGPNCGHADGTGANMKLYFPRGVAFDGSSVFIADPMAQTIQQLVLATNTLTTLSGAPQDCAVNCNCMNGTTGSYSPGVGKAALWNDPWDIIYDPDTKSLLVSDSDNFVIRRIK